MKYQRFFQVFGFLCLVLGVFFVGIDNYQIKSIFGIKTMILGFAFMGVGFSLSLIFHWLKK